MAGRPLAVGTLVRMMIAALACAVVAYALLEMRDTGPPPRDTSAESYFFWFVLLGPAVVALILALRQSLSAYMLTALAGVFGLAAFGAVAEELDNMTTPTASSSCSRSCSSSSLPCPRFSS